MRAPRGQEGGPAPRPLAGKTVVLTRAAESSEEWKDALEEAGAIVEVLPVVRFAAVRDDAETQRAIAERAGYSHVVFTSATAVKHFFEAAGRLGSPAAEWRRLRCAVVGAATARACRDAGLVPEIIGEHGGQELADLILARDGVRAQRLLLPQSSIARPELRERLEAAGRRVTALTIYETQPEETSKAGPLLRSILSRSTPLVFVFASPSALRAFLELGGAEAEQRLAAGSSRIVSLGPTTTREIRARGLVVAATAERPEVLALVDAIVLAG
ncbi:MAG TPA: uroporphyrinogen-III synthase [Planctomycetota bacterium]|nr:uroporphyrinogen-III synthase [Planctomycetota bacterium]